ncbi:MAG: tail fiber domain-containing protein, partial [Bacteroidia bacterium]|nr:tail fiber domain-containing protein [Bacteroidia bacterium]
NTDITRVSISHNPASPVTRPLSLLHLGYNTGAASFSGASTDGWRSWMDIGTFGTNGTDNFYFGLKQEKGGAFSTNDRWDAVINWGDNEPQTFPPGSGPDNLRFIFTSTTTGTGTSSPGNSQEGVEGMRMTPVLNPYQLTQGVNETHLFTGIGGDPFINQYTGGNNLPQNTLEVNSYFPGSAIPSGAGHTQAPGFGLPTGLSGLRLTDLRSTSIPELNPGKGVLALNSLGDLIYVPADAGFGNVCGGSTNALTNNWEVVQGNFDLNFVATNGTAKFGNITCGTPAPARVFIRNTFASKSVGLWVENSYAPGGGTAGYFKNTNGGYGVVAIANAAATIPLANIGVYADGPNVTGQYAGYFDGDVFINNPTIGMAGYVQTISDSIFKTDVTDINNGLQKILQLKPKEYYLDSLNPYNLHFSKTKQYGFVAQNVEQIIPELVSNAIKPAEADSAGNIVFQSLNYKTLNYDGILPFAIKAIQEQQLQIEEIKKTPNAPTLLLPANNASGDYHEVTLTWNSVSSGLVLYHVQISKDSTFTIIYSESDERDTTISLGLDSAQWYWRVKALNNFGSGAWSQTFNFTNTVNQKDGGPRDFPQSTLSDISLKQNVSTLNNSLDKVKQLRGVDYKWNANGLALMQGDTSKQIGMIAQEVKTVFPEVVYEEDSVLHVDYQHLVPVLVEAVKELAKKDSLKNIKMNDMQAQLDSIKMVMSACCSNQNTRTNTNITFTDVELSDKNIIVLNQNAPNPFAEQTTITYNIPTDFSFAQILFYDLNGRMIKAVDIKQKGRGSLNVYANDLSNGIYSYTLIIDNKIIDTKKMIKQD